MTYFFNNRLTKDTIRGEFHCVCLCNVVFKLQFKDINKMFVAVGGRDDFVSAVLLSGSLFINTFNNSGQHSICAAALHS